MRSVVENKSTYHGQNIGYRGSKGRIGVQDRTHTASQIKEHRNGDENRNNHADSVIISK